MGVTESSSAPAKHRRFGGVVRIGLCAAVLVPVGLFVATSAFPATITSFTGTIGRAQQLPYCTGSILTISGSGFVNDGGVKSVTIGGVPAAYYFVGADNVMYATVGPGATSGPVVVTTPLGSVTSTQTFSVFPCASQPSTEKPTITGVGAKKVKGGKKVELLGSGFVGTTGATVDGSAAAIAIPTDVNMYVTVPKTAANGKVTITITSPNGTATTTAVTKTG